MQCGVLTVDAYKIPTVYGTFPLRQNPVRNTPNHPTGVKPNAKLFSHPPIGAVSSVTAQQRNRDS